MVHGKVLLFNLFLPLLLFFILQFYDPTIALVAFVVAITPTAGGGPIIAELLESDVAFVTISVLVTSVGVAFMIPLLLPQVMVVEQSIEAIEVLLPVFMIVFLPLLLAQSLKYFWQSGHRMLLQLKPFGFYLFLINIFIASGKASHFVQMDEETGLSTILSIAALSGLLCALNFSIGHRLGTKAQTIETGLALGRKNNMFAIWLALTFTQPVIALGPIFYIVFQNLYNSWQMWSLEKSKKPATVSP